MNNGYDCMMKVLHSLQLGKNVAIVGEGLEQLSVKVEGATLSTLQPKEESIKGLYADVVIVLGGGFGPEIDFCIGMMTSKSKESETIFVEENL